MLTNEQIAKGNELIAEYMGFQKTDLGWFDNDGELSIDGSNTFDELRFHESWDWLMPVVDKIERTPIEVDVFCDFNILGGRQGAVVASGREELVRSSKETKLLSAWSAAAEFIGRYNDNKNM